MTKTVEDWEIEVGNAATVTELVRYAGTELGAKRRAHKRWRTRAENEHSLSLHRPGCRPLVFLTED